MYLSTKEHDKLRTIVMGFEIPFRTYIAKKITLSYPDASSFFSAIDHITLPDNASQELKSKYGQMKSQFAYYYQLFEMTIQSSINKIVENDINVPDVGTLVSTVKIFEPLFHDYTSCFSNYNTFIAQLDKYHYVRNKLDHPGCKTLDTEDMIPTLNFISDSCTYIGIEYEECFWDKPECDIYQEIRSLESLNSSIPIPINNFSNIPFSDKKIVCRNKEIEDVKTFIYGIPNALRKKSSLCIYGYGGLGKTAIVTEVIKSIVQDISDNNTTNNYHPDFILFFSAKEEFLEISQTSGDILCQKQRQNFTTLEELETSIYNALNIESFANFNKTGIIVIDNLESIHEDERAKIYTFVESMSPISVQYIITSRNEENYQERMGISGFSNTNGKKFIHEYVEENNLDLSLSETEMEQLLESTKGNTLVLVLSLRRLSRKIATIEGITSDLSALPTVSNIVNEFSTIPLNGYDIISEFMFKNTFDELEKTFKEHADLLFSLLKIFAVYPNQEIDIYTICMLSDLSYININPYINLLCQYLILEKNGETYHLNSFAELKVRYCIKLQSVTSSGDIFVISCRTDHCRIICAENRCRNIERISMLITGLLHSLSECRVCRNTACHCNLCYSLFCRSLHCFCNKNVYYRILERRRNVLRHYLFTEHIHFVYIIKHRRLKSAEAEIISIAVKEHMRKLYCVLVSQTCRLFYLRTTGIAHADNSSYLVKGLSCRVIPGRA